MILRSPRCLGPRALTTMIVSVLLGAVILLSNTGGQVAEAGNRVTSPSPVRIVANTGPSHNPDAWYRPGTLTVRVGQTVTWRNDDEDVHDVTSRVGGYVSPFLAYKGVFHWTPRKPGRYPYFCTVHSEMHGVIIVRR